MKIVSYRWIDGWSRHHGCLWLIFVFFPNNTNTTYHPPTTRTVNTSGVQCTDCSSSVHEGRKRGGGGAREEQAEEDWEESPRPGGSHNISNNRVGVLCTTSSIVLPTGVRSSSAKGRAASLLMLMFLSRQVHSFVFLLPGFCSRLPNQCNIFVVFVGGAH